MNMDKPDLHRLSRREVLKLSPIVLAGAFFFDPVKASMSKIALRFSDWVSDKQFDAARLAETLPDSAVAPFEQFPYNYYDVLDPAIYPQGGDDSFPSLAGCSLLDLDVGMKTTASR